MQEQEGRDTEASMKFFCECSLTTCNLRIELTPKAYKDFHQNQRRFIAIPGHEIQKIEKIISHEKGFNVIEKFGDPPTRKDIGAALKKIKP